METQKNCPGIRTLLSAEIVIKAGVIVIKAGSYLCNCPGTE